MHCVWEKGGERLQESLKKYNEWTIALGRAWEKWFSPSCWCCLLHSTPMKQLMRYACTKIYDTLLSPTRKLMRFTCTKIYNTLLSPTRMDFPDLTGRPLTNLSTRFGYNGWCKLFAHTTCKSGEMNKKMPTPIFCDKFQEMKEMMHSMFAELQEWKNPWKKNQTRPCVPYYYYQEQD